MSCGIWVALLGLITTMGGSVIVAGLVLAWVLVSEDEEAERPDEPAVQAAAPVPDPDPDPDPAPIAPPLPTVAPDEPATPTPDPVPSTRASATIRLAPGSPGFVALRVMCRGETTRQIDFRAGVVTVPDLPRSTSCTARFIGGLGASTKIRGGQDLACSFPQGTAVCQ